MPELISIVCFFASKTMMSPSSTDQPQRWLLQILSPGTHQGMHQRSNLMSPWAMYTSVLRKKTWLPRCCLGWPTPVCPCRHDHLWLAWWHKRCSQDSSPMSHSPWCTNHWVSNHSQRSSPLHPSCWEWEGSMCHIWGAPWHYQVPVLSMTMCLLALDQLWYQTNGWGMPHMLTTSPSGTKAATQANSSTWAPLETSRSLLHDLWWIWIPSCGGLLLKDAKCQKDAYISVQCSQNNLHSEGAVCWAWNSRVSLYRQWPTVCQCPLYWVCWWVELCTPYRFTHKAMK